jgi:hypothetical protein
VSPGLLRETRFGFDHGQSEKVFRGRKRWRLNGQDRRGTAVKSEKLETATPLGTAF